MIKSPHDLTRLSGRSLRPSVGPVISAVASGFLRPDLAVCRYSTVGAVAGKKLRRLSI